MALIKCTDCGKEISDKAGKCIHCGCPISNSVRQPVDNNANSASRQVICEPTPDISPLQRNETTNGEEEQIGQKYKKKLMRRPIILLSFLSVLILDLIAILICSAMNIDFKDWSTVIGSVIMTIYLVSIFPSIFAFFSIPAYIRFFRDLKHLEERKLLGKAYLESKSKNVVKFGDKATISDHFFFGGSRKRLPIPCDEILWVYVFESTTYGAFRIGTKNFGLFTCSGCDKSANYKNRIEASIDELQKRAPNLMIGNTAENRARYKQLANTK